MQRVLLGAVQSGLTDDDGERGQRAAPGMAQASGVAAIVMYELWRSQDCNLLGQRDPSNKQTHSGSGQLLNVRNNGRKQKVARRTLKSEGRCVARGEQEPEPEPASGRGAWFGWRGWLAARRAASLGRGQQAEPKTASRTAAQEESETASGSRSPFRRQWTLGGRGGQRERQDGIWVFPHGQNRNARLAAATRMRR